ncbi:MAG: hypothetical protein PHI31_06770 [Desulfuromonadaceae bacterium]|nr:hypothetical protein [Desulfuromonadaceae bacterium]
MTQTSTQTTIIRDRNKIAYLIACGFQCDFVPRNDGGLDAEFANNQKLDLACIEYALNRAVPVQAFIAACRYISDAIYSHRQRDGGRS